MRACLVLLFAVSGISSAQTQLQVARPVVAEIKRGDTHAYGLHLERNHFASIVVKQEGLDLALALKTPAGRTLIETTLLPVHGSKELFWIAEDTGDYRIAIRSTADSGESGRYQLTLRELRPSDPADRTRVAAFIATCKATELLDKKGRTKDDLLQAISSYNEALPLWRSLNDTTWSAYSGNGLGNAYLDSQELSKARDILLATIPLQRTVGDPRLLAMTLSTLGAVYNDTGEFRESMKVLEEALPLRRAAADRKGEANTLNNIAFVLTRLGDRPKAIELHLQALAIRREIHDNEGLTLQLGNLAALYRYQGQMQTALEMGAEQLTVAREMHDDRREADAMAGLGTAYYALGDIAKAQSYWKDAEPKFDRAGDALGLAAVLSSLGAANVSLRDYKSAAHYYARSLDIRRKASNAGGQISSLLGICYALRASGDPAGGRKSAEEALAIATKIESKQGIGRSLRCLGQCDLKLGDLQQARDRLDQAAATLRASGDLDDLSLTLGALADAEARSGDLTSALSHVREAIQLAETERAGLSADLRALRRGSRAEHYALEIDILMRMHRTEPASGFAIRALEASERSRARSLVEMVSDSGLDLRQHLTPEQRSREERILSRIASLQREIFREAVAPARKRELDQQLGSAERDLELHQIDLRRSANRYAQVNNADILSPGRIQSQLLDGRSALIEFAIGEEQSYVWAITRDSIVSAVIPGRAQIEQQVAAFRKELTERVSTLTVGPALARVQEAGKRLYRTLLAPVDRILSGTSSLIIVPDGSLAYLPFEALVSDKPLIERFAVSYVPSASTLVALRNRASASNSGGDLIAFGDPAYGSQVGALSEYAERGFSFTQLPNTRLEVAGIQRLFGAETARVYLGERATELAVKTEDLRKYRFIHFAAHGYFDEERPSRSGIVLSPGAGTSEDGILQAREIMRLRIAADLVTLSACQTGLGHIVAGEGLLGLARSFFFAGAQSVVVSLWNVNDSATAGLMKSFYTNLSRGVSREEALRQAKLSLLRGPQRTWRHPYYWAPFVFVGTPR